MNEEQQAAYVHAQANAAMIEALGKFLDAWVAHTTRIHGNQYELMARTIIENYGIHHNAVIDLFTNR